MPKLTETQNKMIEEAITYNYVPYVLHKQIAFVPGYLWEDAEAVAYEALCNAARLYDETRTRNGVRASFQTYAVQSMKKSVLKFLHAEQERNTHPFTDIDQVADEIEDTYYASNALERLTMREYLKEIYQCGLIDEEMKQAFLLWADGWTMEEIAEHLKIPIKSLRNRIVKARQKIARSGKCGFRKTPVKSICLS